MNEYEVALESKKDKDIQESNSRVGETRKRHNEENDDITPEREQRRRNSGRY